MQQHLYNSGPYLEIKLTLNKKAAYVNGLRPGCQRRTSGMYSQLGNGRYDDHDIFKRQQLSSFNGHSLYRAKNTAIWWSEC